MRLQKRARNKREKHYDTLTSWAFLQNRLFAEINHSFEIKSIWIKICNKFIIFAVKFWIEIKYKKYCQKYYENQIY